MEYLNLVFDQYEVSEANYICVTRNADIAPDDESLEVTEDFRYLMKQTLHKRRRIGGGKAGDCRKAENRRWKSISVRNLRFLRNRSSVPGCP